ncbi:MAG: hypothetical protein ACI81O_002343 [Cyclobacteriaceae bacterium]|jgi:hypothetical protein
MDVRRLMDVQRLQVGRLMDVQRLFQRPVKTRSELSLASLYQSRHAAAFELAIELQHVLKRLRLLRLKVVLVVQVCQLPVISMGAGIGVTHAGWQIHEAKKF